MDLYLFLGFLVLLGVWAVLIYNRLIALKNRCSNAFAQIEVQLKRRYDLIPNLVESAKAAMAHERETLEAVITARNQAQAGLEQAAANPEDGAALSALSAAEGVLGKALGQFRVTLEAYPDLKTNQNMMQLTETLESTEIRWPSPAKPLTTRSWPITPTGLASPRSFWRTTLATPRTSPCWSSRTARQSKRRQSLASKARGFF